jgi:hypothetical protein
MDAAVNQAGSLADYSSSSSSATAEITRRKNNCPEERALWIMSITTTRQ